MTILYYVPWTGAFNERCPVSTDGISVSFIPEEVCVLDRRLATYVLFDSTTVKLTNQ